MERSRADDVEIAPPGDCALACNGQSASDRVRAARRQKQQQEPRSPQQLTVIPGSGCIPATHFGKDDSLQFSSLRGHILACPYFGPNPWWPYFDPKKQPGSCVQHGSGWGLGRDRRRGGDEPAATCCIGGVVRNGGFGGWGGGGV